MCSRERTGSMSVRPTSPSSAVTVLEIFSRKISRLPSQGMEGDFREARMLTGAPASEPGV